ARCVSSPTAQPPPAGPSPHTTGVSFTALNGTDVLGAGAAAQALLVKHGYTSVQDATNAPSAGATKTTIYYRGGQGGAQNKSDAAYVAQTYFNGATVKKLDPSRSRSGRGRRDRRRDRRTAPPGVLPRTVRPHLRRGFAVRPPRLLGRRCHCGATGLRTTDGGGPCGPPPGDVSGNGDGQPGGTVVAVELTGSSSRVSRSTPSPSQHPCP